ncbi:MAG: hypothetical protein R2813_13990 [Flavobacteriales bacterium]
MKTIKYYIPMIALMGAALTFNACDREKDEEEEAPELMFKSGGSYTAADATVSVGDVVTIGIEAEVHEEKDPLKKFNISKSVNGGALEDVYNEDLSSESFDYDFTVTIDSTQKGNTEKYTFTVTNRDGLTGQKSLTLTVN